MYARWVEADLGDDCKVSVFVFCTPDTPEDEMQERAIGLLQRRIDNKRWTAEKILEREG